MPYGLYIHIPFCRVRCAYCDFNTYAGLEGRIPAYLDALRIELAGVARASEADGEEPEIESVFFGGGTPSLMPAASIGDLVAAVRANYKLSGTPEITLEANPGTVGRAYLEDLRGAGVNRLSFGMQSAHPAELRLLDRLHDFPEVIHAVRDARLAGFQNINLDLIYGLPGQDMAHWQTTVRRALELGPDHLSMYCLSLEFGTPMRRWVLSGLLPEPDPDLAAEMYEWADGELGRAGFQAYEISNWARRTDEGDLRVCRHNLHVWRNLPYLGFGAGAHGYADGWRYANVRSPNAYIDRIVHGPQTPFPCSPAADWREAVDTQQNVEDTMILGLRLVEEGVSRQAFTRRTGRSLEEVYGGAIAELQTDGLLAWQEDTLRLTRRGRLLGNRVFARFLLGT